jgi:hypothetical protein
LKINFHKIWREKIQEFPINKLLEHKLLIFLKNQV